MSEHEWPTLGYSVKGNRYEIKATRGEIYEAYTDEQIIELVDRRALAAKDARIAELEQKNENLHAVMSAMELNDAMRHERAQRHEPVAYVLFRDGEVCYEADDNIVISNLPGDSSDLYQWLPVFTNPTMAKNANVAATPSEDGGEVPEVVAWLDERGAHVPPHCVSFQDDRKKFERAMASNGAEPLMTVAQYSRIVAAKDAELKELRDSMAFRTSLIGRLESELEQLRAQSARQVGGGEREQFEAWISSLPDATGAIEAGLHEWDEVHERYSNREGSGNAIQNAWVGWKARAALAPAAVAVVLPPEAKQEVPGYYDPSCKDWDDGFNACLSEVARLNRRAIPEGLIEASRRAADILGSQGFAAWDQLAAELRALLGKEGE